MLMNKQRKMENILYLALWAILFVAPVLTLYVRTSSDKSLMFNWTEVMSVWKLFFVYLLVFVIHNFFIAPQLIYNHKKLTYFITVICMLIAFQVYQCNSRPQEIGMGPLHPDMLKDGRNIQRPDFKPDRKPNMQMQGGPGKENNFRPDKAPDMHHDNGPRDIKTMDGHHPPIMIDQQDIVAFVIVFLMLGMNLGIKLYCKSDADAKEMKDLEQKNLEQQLEYLKYQINPHFFMNTLNNIHALVDIDPEKAKTTIVELSKMMRYLLYEGSKQLVPLQKEQQFVESYISLMKLRYTDMVDIINDVPDQLPNMMIPPLLTINFIENAFKHGVSYKQKSFIHIELRVIANRLYFSCQNSKHQESTKEQGGVGIVNTRKRLDLIFGENYSLEINNKNDNYEVKLDIPLTKASNTEDQKEDA